MIKSEMGTYIYIVIVYKKSSCVQVHGNSILGCKKNGYIVQKTRLPQDNVKFSNL